MTDRDDKAAKAQEEVTARDRLRYQWMLDSISKFRLFFAGLVFAMLSFSVQFSVVSANRAVKWCQLVAWALLLVTGVLALRDAGGLVAKNTEDGFDGLTPAVRLLMWGCFVVALVLLMSARLVSDAQPGR